MFKSKARLFAIAYAIFVISLMTMGKNYAQNGEKSTYWKVAITSGTKELKDTQEMNFEIEDNPNVAKGKIAPGSKAKSTIEIDITNTKVPVDIEVNVDDSNLYKVFKLTAKLDGENYEFGTVKTIELGNETKFTAENGKRILIIELEWVNDDKNNELDTMIGSTLEEIKVPVSISVSQHI